MAFSSLASFFLLLVVAVLRDARSLPQGPPVERHFNNVCNLMTPLHQNNRATAGNGGFFIETDLPRNGYDGFNYTAGNTYTVTVNSTERTFRGFLVIAHVPGEDQMLLGSFTPQNASQQTLNCSATGASNEIESTIAHNNSALIDFQSVTMNWTAPSDQNGMVDFRFTVVHDFTTFFVYQRASLDGLTQPTRNPEDYRLAFRSPPDCQVSSCDVFVGIDTNEGDSGFLDIYLEGTADGWVAVGFTETASMFSSDVVACNRDPQTGVVKGLDTYNRADRRFNEVNPVQNVLQFSTNYTDGRLVCSLARKIVPINPSPININLNSDLYILYGRKTGSSGQGALLQHEVNPTISAARHNPVRDRAEGNGDSYPKLPLIRAHGTLMLIAWPLLGVSGIFFASWMRPALPQGQWFKVHGVLMLASLFVGVVGVAMVFIGHAHEDNPRGLIELGSGNPVGTAHFSIGLLIVLLQLINPILAAFRCKPDSRRRWIFNTVHGMSIGLSAQLLAFVNVGLGTYLYRDGVSGIFWAYVCYIVLLLVLFSLLYLIFTLSAIVNRDGIGLAPSLLKPLFNLLSPGYSPSLAAGGETIKVSYSAADDSKTPMITAEKVKDSQQEKKPSNDSYIRWISLTVYLVVSTPVILAMVVLAATSPLNG